MAVSSYSQEVHEFVKKWSPKLRDQDLAEACNKEFGTNFTPSKMKAFRHNHGYLNGKKQWTKEEYWKYQKRYPQGMFEFVRDNSWGVSSKEMAEMVNEKFGTQFTPTMMKQFRQRHGIKSGVTGWYQKGHEPGTKGKTIEEICRNDPEKLARVKETWFKKGTMPPNTLPVGTISIIDGYKLIKVKDKGTRWECWKPLQRKVWEDNNGPIPEGMLVAFKDQDTMNCDISNLMLITRSEHLTMTRQNLRSTNPELTEAGLALVKLEKVVSEKKKKKHRRTDKHI